MFTVCPKCALTLVVTASDLRVAQGYVRCGRCSNVFNAIVGLSEDRQAQAAALARAATPPAPPPPPEPEPEPPVEEEIEAEIEPPPPPPPPAPVTPKKPPAEEPRYSDDVGIGDSELEFDPTATDVTEVFIEPIAEKGETGTFESIILQAEEGALPEEEEPPPPREQPSAEDDELDTELRQLAQRLAAQGAQETAASDHKHPSAQLHAANDESIVPKKAPPPAPAAIQRDEDEEEKPPESGRWVRIAWASGTALLVLVLLLQIAHHYRNDLAVNPRFNGMLTSLYASLGMPLSPHWDLSAYEVRQLGAASEPGNTGRLTVRASLKNGADQPQPMPLLRVTVQDRYGNRIAAGDVAPSVYLPRAIPASSLLGVGQRIDAEMAFVDPGAQAVGFEIDACLPAGNGRIACANDIGPR